MNKSKKIAHSFYECNSFQILYLQEKQRITSLSTKIEKHMQVKAIG